MEERKITSKIKLQDFHAVVFDKAKVVLSEEVYSRVLSSYNFLEKFAKDKLIYGINTGFGPMAQYRIEDSKIKELQRNLIRSHCSGMGEILSETEVRALLLARLNTLCQAKSGVHPDTVQLIVRLLNEQIIPVIYRHGSVGASGDLVQLSHLALTLIGEGEVYYKQQRSDTKSVFEKLNITPLNIYLREGLALMNGTSSMTGILAVNVFYARKLLYHAVTLSCLMNEIVHSYDDHYSEELNNAKMHPGQQAIALAMRNQLDNSRRTLNRANHLYGKKVSEEVIEHKVQEYYSIRCVPQILGPIYEAITFAEQIVEQEVNSANDNPIVDVEKQNVFHGGNFHGDYVAYEADKLKIGITKLTMLAERQLNYLMNPKLNNQLPPFLNKGKLGLNFGFQGIQFTATSTTAECQTLSSPMYIHSIPNNNDNQDIVSMGTNAASLCRRVIDNAFDVLSIHAYACFQAVDILAIYDDLSEESKEYINYVKQYVEPIVEDQPAYSSLRTLREALVNKNNMLFV